MMGRFTAHLPSAHPLDRQLFEAIALLDLPHLQALLDAGAQANAIAPDSGQTALIAAGRVPTQADAVAIAHLLLARGADGNRRGDRGQTPLMQAASQGYGDLVQLLLEQGARVQTQSDDGETALGLAAGATAWVAVAPSAQPSGILRQTAQGPQQLVPLAEPRIIAVVEALLAAGADLNQPDCCTTPLMEAVRYGQLHLVAYLLQRGAEPALAARDGQTALAIAQIYNQVRAIALLEAHCFAKLGPARCP